MEMRKIVNQRIEKLRTEILGLTQEEFAEQLGMEQKKGRSTVNNWEQGVVQVKSDDLRKIGATFDVSVDYLLGLAQFPTIEPNTREAQKVTRLSEKAIANIQKLSSADLLTRLFENDSFMKTLEEISSLEDRIISVQDDCATIRDLQDKQVDIGNPKEIHTWADLLDPKESEKDGVQASLDGSISHLYVEYALLRVAIQDIESDFAEVIAEIAGTKSVIEDGKSLLRKWGVL